MELILNHGKIKTLRDTHCQSIGDDFLVCNQTIVNLVLPQVKTIGDRFLSWNQIIVNLVLPQIKIIGNDFLNNHPQLTKANYLKNIKKEKVR